MNLKLSRKNSIPFPFNCIFLNKKQIYTVHLPLTVLIIQTKGKYDEKQE